MSEQARQGKPERGSTPPSKTRDVVDEPPTKATPTKQKTPSIDDSFAKITLQKQKVPPISDRGSAARPQHNMDPFEVRVRFTQFLGNLNASVTSAQKTAQYAIKYRDMDEDLHNCIIEQLERVCLLSIS